MAAPPRYPVMLDLVGRRCLVVGGGAVALRKARSLLEAGASVTVVAPVVAPALAELAATGALRWIERSVTPDDPLPSGPWRLVVAATDDAALNGLIARASDDRGIWAADVSAPTGGAVSTPAVHRAGPVTVAVSTSGVSPSAAAWIRDEVVRGLDPAVVVALELLAEVLAEEPAERLDWQQVLDSGTLDDIRHGRRARAKERLQACLSSSSD